MWKNNKKQKPRVKTREEKRLEELEKIADKEYNRHIKAISKEK